MVFAVTKIIKSYACIELVMEQSQRVVANTYYVTDICLSLNVTSTRYTRMDTNLKSQLEIKTCIQIIKCINKNMPSFR